MDIVKHIKATDCDLELRTRQSWRAWKNREQVVLGDFDSHGEIDGYTLKLEDYHGTLTIPKSHTPSITLENSTVKGKNNGYAIKTIGDCNVNLERIAAYNLPKHPVYGALINGAKDVAKIGLIALPTTWALTMGAQEFGFDPTHFVDDSMILALGAYLGIAGRNKQSMYTSIGAALALSFGQEAYEVIQHGEPAWRPIAHAVEYTLAAFAGAGIRRFRDAVSY